MTTEQPYFTVKVTRCWECPAFDDYTHLCGAMKIVPKSEKRRVAWENRDGLTPSCPMWAQVQQEKKDG